MLKRYALRDGQWERIKDLLPGEPGHVGANARDTGTHRCIAPPLPRRYCLA